ncbi:hypothetical protein PAHAL_1G390100 [Panicum hallii]|uniref:Uncharacterized protein n=1 Tax=Panicum hallii TaxID=206008 RepID=A0A2T8KXS5_9POAL|nr:hypothetical protein PAHAL_1G390100 [Panicum hallii]
MDFRKKNGLCWKCGEKWGHNHKCPPQVSLHVIEELFDALEQSEESDSVDSDEDMVHETVMAVSGTPVNQPAKRRTIKLQGKIGDHDVLILVDSGSVGTFLSEQLVTKLRLGSQSCEPTNFQPDRLRQELNR